MGTGCRLRVLPEVLEGLAADDKTAVDLMLRMMFGPNAASAVVQAEHDAFSEMPLKTLLEDLLACDAFDVSDRLGRIQCPTLVISGSEDRLTPVKYGEYLHRHIPASRISVIDGAGHMMALENTGAVVELFRSFIGRALPV